MATLKSIAAGILALLVTTALFYLFIVGGMVMAVIGGVMSAAVIIGALFVVSWTSIRGWLDGR